MNRRDLLWAAAAACVSLAVYVRTLAPGVVAEVDTPMFQFIGRVLGVAHNPGYPLYVLLTHPIALLPIGSLPYRINLFSAVCGALAVALVFLVARRLGCGRPASLVASLGLAFGQVFWSQAVIAEVYTMHAALVAGALLGMLEWGRSHRPSAYYAGVAALAAGFAHHTTIVAFLPAMVVYAWLTDRRFLLRPRTLLTTGAILVAGLLPYGFIVVRSNQPGAYLESKATSIAQLPNVIFARQFRDRVFAFDWHTVLTDRLPGIAHGVLASELTFPGWRSPSSAPRCCFDGGCRLRCCCWSAPQPSLGLRSTTRSWTRRCSSSRCCWCCGCLRPSEPSNSPAWQRKRVTARNAIVLAALLLPAFLLAHNFERNDRSRDTGTAVFLDRLFEALPARTALVTEDFLVDRLMMFKLLADDAARGRSIAVVEREGDVIRRRIADGAAVFAFAKTARRLRLDGFDVGFQPLALADLSLAELAASVPDGSVVALAAPASLAAQFAASAGASFSDIGGPTMLARAARASVAMVGVSGARSGALVRADAIDTGIDIARGGVIGDTGRVAPAEISIRRGRDRREHPAGLARSRANLRGRGPGGLAARRPADACAGPAGGGRLSRVASGRPAVDLPGASGARAGGTRRLDRPHTRRLATGSVVVRVPAGLAMVMKVSDDRPLQPRVVDRSSDGAHVEITRAADRPLDLYRYTYWIDVRAAGAEPCLGAARVWWGASGRAGSPCRRRGRRLPSLRGLRGLLRTPDRVTEMLLMSRDEQSQLVGVGWSSVDADGGGAFRWMTAPEARVLLPVTRDGARRVRIQALREANGPAVDPDRDQRHGVAMAAVAIGVARLRMGSARRCRATGSHRGRGHRRRASDASGRRRAQGRGDCRDPSDRAVSEQPSFGTHRAAAGEDVHGAGRVPTWLP